MKKLKTMLRTLIFVSVISASLSGCSNETGIQSSSEAELQSVSESLSSAESSVQPIKNEVSQSQYFDEKDLLTDYKDVTASIKLSNSNAEIDGTGAEYKDGVISLTSGGTFVFSGEMSDGRIYVNNSQETHIVFDGVNISCSSYSPFFVENSDKVILTLADGTQNSLSDSANYIYENGEENEPDAVIFSKDDLSVNGGGSLEIKANYNEGITCKDDLRIAQCSLNISSVGNAVKGKDSVAVNAADIIINSQEDGIKTSNTDEADKGYMVFESGTFDITSLQDAVQAEGTLTINGGEYTIKSGNREELSDTANQDNGNFGRGFMGQEGNQNKTEESQKALKASGNIAINDGVIAADSEDDSVHSNGNV
ncbi:carbohydrate-binding domain-containing protein, partial [Porcipelethomonas sp.]|uniref:carbohydrate-binding domain-containing protein n=1 Tax=Porcipelethomonas sp. TaxID=2981675 RepID=UPI003EF17EC7